MEENQKLPEHIAIIMDGNGRWAKAKGLTRNQGHKKGAEVLSDMTKYAEKIGIKYITVYAFSTENWNRPKDEVEGLMQLLRQYLTRYQREAKKNNIKVRVIGNKAGLPEDIKEKIDTLHALTEEKTGLTMSLAINYGGRDELVRATQKMFNYLQQSGMGQEAINEELLAACLDTDGIPDPDLLIRTSGEMRTSNFLPWQLAYSEFYFTPCSWPEFTKEEFIKALETYGQRKRRFGKSE